VVGFLRERAPQLAEIPVPRSPPRRTEAAVRPPGGASWQAGRRQEGHQIPAEAS